MVVLRILSHHTTAQQSTPQHTTPQSGTPAAHINTNTGSATLLQLGSSCHHRVIDSAAVPGPTWSSTWFSTAWYLSVNPKHAHMCMAGLKEPCRSYAARVKTVKKANGSQQLLDSSPSQGGKRSNATDM